VNEFSLPSRLRLDGAALVRNWRALARLSGAAACGAAIKANGYGLGARAVMTRLARAGCRDFFVATWTEAAELADIVHAQDLSLSVLHGVRAEDMAAALTLPARPVLNTATQVARWREQADGRACDAMVDTGMKRLGLAASDIGLLHGLNLSTLMSHLACAEEASPLNERQRGAFADVAATMPEVRHSLANSAGIGLGADYAFGLTRPGIALYGGVPCAALDAHIAPVLSVEAQILQRRTVEAGESVGYNATWTATARTEVAAINLGYADGIPRDWHRAASASVDGVSLPVVGRVSMDLTVIDVGASPSLGEGDWVTLDWHLPDVAEATGRSQYELLTGMGARFERKWID
jgi:alanine racemase